MHYIRGQKNVSISSRCVNPDLFIGTSVNLNIVDNKINDESFRFLPQSSTDLEFLTSKLSYHLSKGFTLYGVCRHLVSCDHCRIHRIRLPKVFVEVKIAMEK